MMYSHQVDGLKFLKEHNGGYLAFDCGTGKTRIIIELLKAAPKDMKLLVICPLSLIDTAWADDVKKFSSFRMCNMRDGITDADIYVTNYETFCSRRRTEELDNLILKHRFICCLDESSRIGNVRAKTTKAILARRHAFPVRICLSGTPACQSDELWWPQITFIKSGILHDSPFAFRNEYFQLQRGRQCLPLAGQSKDTYRMLFSKGWKVAIDPRRRDHLYERLARIVLLRKLDDCVDLPEEIDQTRLINMDDDQADNYTEMKNALITEIRGEEIVAQVALTKLMKLRQITSGFAITPEGDAIRMPVNPKLDELCETLEELGDEQAIIFFNFRAEGADIKSRLDDRVVIVDGDTRDKTGAINGFKSGKYRYLAANLQSLAHGVTLVNARYCIYYSMSYSLEDYLQSRARTRRIGQKKTCVYIHLACKKTIDEVIIDVIKKKGEATEIIKRTLR